MKHFSILFLILFVLGACTYTMKIQDGTMAVDRKQYAVAVPMLKKEFDKAKTRVEKGKIAYLLGLSYNGLNQGSDAISWFKKAYDNQYGIEAFEAYAFALKQDEQYVEAARVFKELGLEIGSPYQYRKQITSCEVAAAWKAEERQAYQIEAMIFNSAASDYAPTLLGAKKLAFTSDRNAAKGDDNYNWTGKSFSDIFVVDLATNQVESYSSTINTDANEGTLAVSLDGNKIYFTRCDAPKGVDAYCKIMSSTKAPDGSWAPATMLAFQQTKVNYMHPALSADGQTLFYSSDDDDGWGGYDIYSIVFKNNKWEEPKRLSRSINTPKDEQFPQLDSDTLYFASSGHTGMGGLDVFKSHQLPSGNWSPPWNLKTPINSGSDDFGFVVNRYAQVDGNIIERGFFTSRRGDIGNDDIYEFTRVILPPRPVKENIVYKNVLDVYVVENIYDDPTDPNSRILGKRPLPGATILVKTGKQERSFEIDKSGKISLQLQDNKRYNFFASKENYLNNKGRFSSYGLGKDPSQPEQLFEVEILLDKIFLNKEITLENIYYDFEQSYIREDAQPTLLELTSLLKDNPAIRIELGSHTDCRGGDQYNADLSRRRAQAAVDFLIQNEIDASRLEARGFGEDNPFVDCLCGRCTEEEHQANRRTTFRILE